MLDFLYTGVSWVLLRWHDLFTFLGLSSGSGLNWSLSIIFLVITARVALFRFFLKQVHYQRNMQEMQPRLQAIKEKYKNDRQAQQREMMRLQQEEGFNPLAGCLPMLLQIPIFISLFHVLRHLSNSVGLCESRQFTNPKLSLYSFTPVETCQAATARLFGAGPTGGAPLAGSLRDTPAEIAEMHVDLTATRVVIIVLVVISAAATFYTQILVRQSQVTVPVGTAATVQRLEICRATSSPTRSSASTASPRSRRARPPRRGCSAQDRPVARRWRGRYATHPPKSPKCTAISPRLEW